MQPTAPSQGGQVNANWGDPKWVQNFRTQALQNGAAGVSQVDNYIAQNQAAYLTQQKNAVGNTVGGIQGGLTTAQAQANPVAATQFVQGGGQLLNTGSEAQAAIINQAGQAFKKVADKKTGFVSPKDYNSYLAQFNQAGGKSADFESTFGDKYINPKNALYDTPDAKAALATLPIIKNVIDSYHKLQYTGKITKDVSDIPVLGKYIQQNYLAANVAHDSLLNGEIGNIRAIAGAGPGQGFRFNLQELNNIGGLLPTSTDSRAVTNHKLSELDTYMKDNMGVSLKQVYGK